MQAPPIIELFSIGTELALGRVQDTNSFWMAQQIAEMGGGVRRITVLVDDLEEVVAALEGAIARGAQILVTTGGLGPTPDDLTVAALARLAGCGTALSEPLLAEYLQRRGLTRREEATPNMIKMATVPEVAAVFHNPAGWAPCIQLEHAGATILTLPGPPQEVMPLFALHVGPYIASRMPGRTAALRVAAVIPESELSAPMEEVMRRFPTCYLKAYVALRTAPANPLPLDVVARGENDAAAQETLRQAVEYLSELLAATGRSLETWQG